MSTQKIFSFLYSFVFFFSLTVLAEPNHPIGYWETKDDKGSAEKAIVQIYEENGKIFGKIIELIQPEKPDPVCELCTGDNKNKPVKGMKILWDLEKEGSKWSNGFILDPKNGKEYKCSLALKENGTQLEVRGYIGFSLLGRSQMWKRVEAPSS